MTEALGTARAVRIAPLEEDEAGPDGRQTGRGQRIGAEDPSFELVERRSEIERAWRSLDTSEREAFRLRHVEGLTYSAVADRLALSTSQVVRIVERSSQRLRTVVRASERTE